jgi:ferredoxin
MVMGVGIRIDETRCTGCGTCEYVCPVFPKGVRLQPRNEPEPPAP